jgi:CRP-like cAMP-binding protein
MEDEELLTSYISQFKVLSKAEIQLIVNSSKIIHFKKGDFLLKEGGLAKHCYFLMKGCVREYQLKNGEERTTNFYTEGQSIIPLHSSALKVLSKTSLQCSEDCIMTISNERIEQLICSQIPRLSEVIRVELERLTGEIQAKMANFMTSSAEERYIYLRDTRPDLLNRIPLNQLASYIGVKPESLSRIRRRLASKRSLNP